MPQNEAGITVYTMDMKMSRNKGEKNRKNIIDHLH